MFRIYIPFHRAQGIGGPVTFMRNLKKYLDDNNYSYQEKPWFARAVFFPIAISYKTLRVIKLFRGKVIQRLDGVYYPSKHSDKYSEYNAQMKDIYINYADHVIFQSEYSKRQVFEMFGPKPNNEYTIIPNGADIEVFYPKSSGTDESIDIIKVVTTGNFRNIDMILPVIEAIDKLIGRGYNIELSLIGPISIAEKEDILSRNYVSNEIFERQNDLADKLRDSDLFIYSHLNPPCPNSVIEAICCGLPVVGFDSGSLRELCFFNEELFAYVSEDVFQRYEDFDPVKLADKLLLAISDYDRFKAKAMDFSSYYSMDKCARAYIEVFGSA